MKAAILGGSGYVGGELLRLLISHPVFDVVAVASRSLIDLPVHEHFPHLRSTCESLSFCDPSALERLAAEEGLNIFAALPHGESAKLIDALLDVAHSETRIIDLSADFRFADADRYREIYGQEHGAPHLLPDFDCLLPDLIPHRPPSDRATHRAHPGCFTTAVTLALAPLHQASLGEGAHYSVSAMTGSTGSGKTPSATTHHPERHGNVKAYKPLTHRHRGEMEGLLEPLGNQKPEVSFVPHSGPFSRGIHATIQGRLSQTISQDSLLEVYREFYQDSSFVFIESEPPSLTSVVGTNNAKIFATVSDHEFALFCVIDNLVKGAAGGAIQSMNQLRGLAPDKGLHVAGLGWY